MFSPCHDGLESSRHRKEYNMSLCLDWHLEVYNAQSLEAHSNTNPWAKLGISIQKAIQKELFMYRFLGASLGGGCP